MEDIRIPITCTCRECDGTGIIYNTDYNEFSKFSDGWLRAHPEYKNGPYTEEQEKAENDWWADRGYPGGVSNWPPEEWECDNCSGTGREKTEISPKDLRTYIASMSKSEQLK